MTKGKSVPTELFLHLLPVALSLPPRSVAHHHHATHLVADYSAERRGVDVIHLSSRHGAGVPRLSVVWDAIVIFAEHWTHSFAQRKFLTTAELMGVGAIVVYGRFLERIRNDRDGISIARGQRSTDWDVLSIVYRPLLCILQQSMLDLGGFLLVKMVYYCGGGGGTAATPSSNSDERLQARSGTRGCQQRLCLAHRFAPRAWSAAPTSYWSWRPVAAFVTASLLFDFGVVLNQNAATVYAHVGFSTDVVPPIVERIDYCGLASETRPFPFHWIRSPITSRSKHSFNATPPTLHRPPKRSVMANQQTSGPSSAFIQKPMKDTGATSPATRPPVRPLHRRRKMTSWQTTQWCYHWLLWLFFMGLVLAQFSCAVWDSSTRREVAAVGQLPPSGPHDLALEVDPEPYADRIIVCVLDRGRQYQPMRLSTALARSTNVQQEDATMIHAYRIVRRDTHVSSTDATAARYAATCDLIARTTDAIVDSCHALGYNVTSDYVRVVDGLEDTAAIVGVTDSLPVLIEPVADDSTTSRYIVPGYDGTACIVRLLGAYETPTATSALVLRGVNRTVYEQKSLAFLGLDNTSLPGGWRNGWFEDSTTMSKWHSEVISTVSDPLSDTFGIRSRVFDMDRMKEMTTTATAWPVERTWGSIVTASETLLWYHCLSLSNGTRFGIFRYEVSQIYELRSTYTLETLLVNLSIAWVLVRWAACMVALQRCFMRGHTAHWQAASLGSSVSCMRSFHVLPLVLLVRLKVTFAVFWTVGGWFTGDQSAASEAWFVVYPSIAELVLLQFSLVNTVAKVLRRRVSGVMVGPTLVFLSLLHLFRTIVFVEPLNSCVTSTEMNSLPLSAMFSSSVVLRLNGNVAWLVYVKLAVLVSNWLPLVVRYKSNQSLRTQSSVLTVRTLEKALALRVTNLGGFGSMDVCVTTPTKPLQESTTEYTTAESIAASSSPSPFPSSSPPTLALAPFEHLRLGYVMLGRGLVLSFNDYFLLLLLAPWRRVKYPPNYRVVVFTVINQGLNGAHASVLERQPELMRLNDPRLVAVDLLDIGASSMY